MKTLIAYLSLLFISGLIIPFYQTINKADTLLHAKPAPLMVQPRPCTCLKNAHDAGAFHFSFISDVVGKILPVVKNLN